MQDSNDQGSLVEAVKQVNTGEHEEDGPLALVLHHSRSVGSSLFEENPPVPLLPEQSVEAAIPIPPCLLAPIETPIFWVPDLNQVPNPLVKASDLLPRKLLILDVEGLLVYAEGFMDRSSKTAAGDDVGAKKGKALDTKERWTRNNREIRLVLKPLKIVWERFPDFNAKNTLLVDVHPYRASANPEETGIFPKPYTGSPFDKHLTTVLLPYLEGLSQAFDIREYVREHVLQGSQRPLHFRATSRGLPGLLH
ncbi:hypothetical protein R1sor_009423 [Riccia sorocarpa]|uniref:FCP1 homology domain-containing protein n=1 Tax=Riccia sorocarpa TaxID=122646 RepID=A0ABD3HXT0_9MARC